MAFGFVEAEPGGFDVGGNPLASAGGQQFGKAEARRSGAHELGSMIGTDAPLRTSVRKPDRPVRHSAALTTLGLTSRPRLVSARRQAAVSRSTSTSPTTRTSTS